MKWKPLYCSLAEDKAQYPQVWVPKCKHTDPVQCSDTIFRSMKQLWPHCAPPESQAASSAASCVLQAQVRISEMNGDLGCRTGTMFQRKGCLALSKNSACSGVSELGHQNNSLLLISLVNLISLLLGFFLYKGSAHRLRTLRTLRVRYSEADSKLAEEVGDRTNTSPLWWELVKASWPLILHFQLWALLTHWA